MLKNRVIFTTDISSSEADRLLERIRKGEPVSAEERLDVIKSILNFSPRDWSTDPELDLIYHVAIDHGAEED